MNFRARYITSWHCFRSTCGATRQCGLVSSRRTWRKFLTETPESETFSHCRGTRPSEDTKHDEEVLREVRARRITRTCRSYIPFLVLPARGVLRPSGHWAYSGTQRAPVRDTGRKGEEGGHGQEARKQTREEGGTKRARRVASVRVTPTLPIRAQTPLFAHLSCLSFSLCPATLSIYLYSFLIRAACRGPTPLAVGLRRNTRGPVPRMRARDGPQALERAERTEHVTLLCSALLRSVLGEERLLQRHSKRHITSFFVVRNIRCGYRPAVSR